MKKCIKYVIAAASAPVLLLAQESGSNDFSFTEAEEAASDLGSALSTTITGSVLPAVISVAAAALSIWVVIRVIRWVRRGAS